MIKPKLTLFQVQMKGGFIHTTKPTEPCLCITPKTLNTIDMRFFLNKLMAPMVDAKMFLVSQINQPIITPPSSRMNDTFKLNTPPDDGLKRLSGATEAGSDQRVTFGLAIGDDFSIDLPISFENTKDYRLAQCPPPSSAINATSTKITFINFNLTRKG
jgi:hypothetical protein